MPTTTGIADSGEILADNAVVTKTPLDANQLKFLPAADESGTDYDGFAFLVKRWHPGCGNGESDYL